MPQFGTRSWQAREALSERRPYTTGGAMRATTGPAPDHNGGWLREKDSVWFAAWIMDRATARYVVWSYDTPIAWVTGGGNLVQPPVTYSLTTTKHQGLLYALRLSVPSGDADRRHDQERAKVAIANSAARERQAQRDRRAEARDNRAMANSRRAYTSVEGAGRMSEADRVALERATARVVSDMFEFHAATPNTDAAIYSDDYLRGQQ